MTKMIRASEFEAECMKVMDEVAETGEPVVITKDGVPIVQLVPAEPVPVEQKQKPESIIGALKDTILYMGDVVSPIDVEWDAMK